MRTITDHDLARASWFHTPSSVALALFPESPEDLPALRDLIGARPYAVIGRGSNVLFAEPRYEAAFVFMTRYRGLRAGPGRRLACRAGEPLPAVLRALRKKGWGGMEDLTGIPGTVGGAVRMNAGAFGDCMAEHVVTVEAFDLARGARRAAAAADGLFSYRRQHFLGPDEIVESVVLAGFGRGYDAARARAVARRRREAIPSRPNCGSVFRNPPSGPAGRLLDGWGAKGYAVGGARVSCEHANIIENTGGATGRDVLRLIRRLQALARRRAGVALEPEIAILTRASLRRLGGVAGTADKGA